MKTVMTMLSLIALMSTTVMAEGEKNPTAAPGIEKRVAKQKQRINRKLSKGKITQEKANELNANVDAVQAKEKEMAADGKLTKGERKELHQELKNNAKEIHQAVKGSEQNTGH